MTGRLRVQVSDRAGVYSNPFLRGGQGVRWTRWRTVLLTDSQEEAAAAYAKVLPELFRRARVVRGRAVVMEATQRGRG